MVRGNNVLPNVHLRKKWQPYVRTWFNQPGRHKRRAGVRADKKRIAGVRPVDKLRPVVHPPTQRYNYKLRAGKGFNALELKTAGLTLLAAAQVGIAVDRRRRNHCQESLNTNVERIKTFMGRLKVFARGKKCKKGNGGLPDDTSRSQLKEAKQLKVSSIVPMPNWRNKAVETRVITENDRKIRAVGLLRKARSDKRLKGKRLKKAAEVREAKAAAK